MPAGIIIVYEKCDIVERVVSQFNARHGRVVYSNGPEKTASGCTVYYEYEPRTRGAVKEFYELANKIVNAIDSCIGILAFGTTAIRDENMCP